MTMKMKKPSLLAFVCLVLFSIAAASHAADESPRPGYMGFAFTSDRGSSTKPPAGWLTVRNIREGEAADRAGLKVGDLIIAIGDQHIEFRDDLDVFKILESVKPGRKSSLTIIRRGKKQRLTITPRPMPDAAWETWKANLAMLRARRSQPPATIQRPD